MASWRRPCSCRAPTSRLTPALRRRAALLAAPLARWRLRAAARRRRRGGSRCEPPAQPPVGAPPDCPAAPQQALCVPADEGLPARATAGRHRRRDRLVGADVPQCLGGLRPDGDGVRLIYKGDVAGPGPAAGRDRHRPAARRRNRRATSPANVTLVREGAGRFYATQGDDKCALDDVQPGTTRADDGRYRLTGRGYCTQPARAVGRRRLGAGLAFRRDAPLVDYPMSTRPRRLRAADSLACCSRSALCRRRPLRRAPTSTDAAQRIPARTHRDRNPQRPPPRVRSLARRHAADPRTGTHVRDARCGRTRR